MRDELAAPGGGAARAESATTDLPFDGVLFLCAANSARSQMAEAIAMRTFGDAVRVQSAGSAPTRVHPLAVRAMAEVGIDISAQSAKALDAVDLGAVDLAITLCGDGGCPVPPRGVVHLHWPLPDPAAARPGDSHARQLDRFRAVRDELSERIAALAAARRRKR